MLVLTRRLDEEILIGDNIRITVVAIDRNRVRLGITAPATVRVVRSELRPHEEAELTGTAVNGRTEGLQALASSGANGRAADRRDS